MDAIAFDFGAYTLDLEGAELRKGAARVHIEPRQLDVLIHLVRNMGRVVPPAELRDVVWGTTTVSDAVLHTALSQLRAALGQQRGERYPIETVSKRGYRFVGARATSVDAQHARQLLWRSYAQHASHGPRSAAECIELADKLLCAEMDRYGSP